MFSRVLQTSLFTLTLALASCTPESNSNNSTQQQPIVVASYTILCDLTEQIAADTVELVCLVDSGQDPHTYSATPADRRAMEQAALVLYGGYEFDPYVVEIAKAIKEEVSKVAVHEEVVPDPILTQHSHDHGKESNESTENHDHDHEHQEEEETEKATQEPDPHVWHDVENAIEMVELISKELVAINPQSEELYQENTEELKAKLTELDTWVQQQVETIPEAQRVLVTTHNALNYYASAYGFQTTEALQGVSGDDEPSASRLKNLVKTIQQKQVPTIFTEGTDDSKAISTVAREAGVKVAEQPLIVDGLGSKESETGSYLGMVVSNTCLIVDNLGGECDPLSTP